MVKYTQLMIGSSKVPHTCTAIVIRSIFILFCASSSFLMRIFPLGFHMNGGSFDLPMPLDLELTFSENRRSIFGTATRRLESNKIFHAASLLSMYAL